MQKEEISINNIKCYIYSVEAPEYVLVQPVNEFEAEALDNEVKMISSEPEEGPPSGAGSRFIMAAFTVSDWNNDLSPWEAPPVYGKEPFGSGASATLSFITEELLPEVRKRYSLNVNGNDLEVNGNDLDVNGNGLDDEIPVILGGYSLAGLFSLWAVTETNEFSAAAASSPSVWFPGWEECYREHAALCDCIYLSMGTKEEKTKNPVMATVGDCVRKQHEFLESCSVPCTLEWNEGNHFRDPDKRTAKGFSWCMNTLKKLKEESLWQFDCKRVKIKAEGLPEFTGIASFCPIGYGLSEFGREEESISILYDSPDPYQIFKSDIESIEIVRNIVDDYIDAQDPKIRGALNSVRAVIADSIPDAEEKISYGMPTWWRGHNLIHFAAQKHHIGLYPGPEAIEHFADVLDRKGFDYSKGAIRIPYDKVELDLVEMIAEYCGSR